MKKKYKILLIVAPCVFVLDQITKIIISSTLTLGEHIPVIPGFFDIVNFRNSGAAFGMFSWLADEVRIPFFYLVAIVAVIFMAILFRAVEEGEGMMAMALSLVLGGIAGNILDRLRIGSVVDFLSFHLGNMVADFNLFGRHFHFPLEWPAFNIADSSITVAMFLIFIIAIRQPKIH